MGRFYKNTDGAYTDFVVSPNLDLRKELANTKIKYAQTMALLDEVPEVNFIFNPEVDNEFAQEKKQAYNEKLQELFSLVRDNPESYRDHLPQIRQVTNELSQDFASGDIYRMQSNYVNWIKDQEEIGALTNPADQDRYKSQAQKWAEAGGSRNGKYEGLTKYESKDYFGEYLQAWGSHLKASGSSVSYDRKRGRYMVTTGNSTTEITEKEVQDSFIAWAKANKEIEGRAAQERDVFGDTSWHDEDGNLSFEEGKYLGDVMRGGAATVAYKDTVSTQTQSADQFELIDYQNKDPQPSYSPYPTTPFLTLKPSQKDVDDLVDSMKANGYSSVTDLASARQKIAELEALGSTLDDDDKELLEEYKNAIYGIDSSITGSWESYGPGNLSPDQIKSIQNTAVTRLYDKGGNATYDGEVVSSAPMKISGLKGRSLTTNKIIVGVDGPINEGVIPAGGNNWSVPVKILVYNKKAGDSGKPNSQIVNEYEMDDEDNPMTAEVEVLTIEYLNTPNFTTFGI